MLKRYEWAKCFSFLFCFLLSHLSRLFHTKVFKDGFHVSSFVDSQPNVLWNTGSASNGSSLNNCWIAGRIGWLPGVQKWQKSQLKVLFCFFIYMLVNFIDSLLTYIKKQRNLQLALYHFGQCDLQSAIYLKTNHCFAEPVFQSIWQNQQMMETIFKLWYGIIWKNARRKEKHFAHFLYQASWAFYMKSIFVVASGYRIW